MQEWEQMTFDPDIWCGKTYPEHSAATKAKILDASLKKLRELRIKPPQFLDLRGGGGATAAASWETGGLLLGEYTMRSFGECPSEENVSRLSQILEAKPHQKYSLSATACAGILRRAENRGKELPEPLKQALIKQSAFKSEQDARGGGKGILIQHEKTGALSTLANQYVCNSERAGKPGGGKGILVQEERIGALQTQNNQAVCIENHGQDSRVKVNENGVVQTLNGRMGTGGNNVPMVMTNDKTHGKVYGIGNGQANQTGLHDKAEALNCMHDQQAVITYGLDRASYNQGKNARYNFSVEEERIGAQVAKGPGAVYNTVVRRLTPLECERLQGYPDGWTDIGEWTDSKGKKHKNADSPRYKALGNSIALPFWQWLANRIYSQYDRQPTMASLFDGIGGFPLVFTRAGAKPVWSSEIEEFPMAVTRLRFGGQDDQQEIQESI